MTLEEALRVGERALGVIKCTYACIYSTSKKKMFSIQKSDTQWNDEKPRTYALSEDSGKEILFIAPIVVANRGSNPPDIESRKYVNVDFTEYAIDVMGEKYDLTKKVSKDDPGSCYAIMDDLIESGEHVMVNKNAIEWFPSGLVFTTEGEYADGKLRTSFNERLAAAEERLNKAKAILIAAGFTNII